jgi:SAM-dependent methyltransferase
MNPGTNNATNWDERYRARDPLGSEPEPLLVKYASESRPVHIPQSPKRALDVACGNGRNALWLARQGWQVTAVDRSPVAIDQLQKQAAAESLVIDAQVADLERGEFKIEPHAWELIVISLYLQRDLFKPAIAGVVPGGHLLAITLLDDSTDANKSPSPFRLRPGELRALMAELAPNAVILHSADSISPTHSRTEILLQLDMPTQPLES